MTMPFSMKLFRRAWIRLALAAAILLSPRVHAQPAERPVESRWLLVFDTSSGMKQRLPQVQAEVGTLFARGMNGRLQPGDSIGVWTFDETPRAGEFPLQSWAPADAATLAAAINKFIGSQRYANTTRFDALMPLLKQVVQDSGRLTVLIFCDGSATITGTPYDDGINRLFQQRQAEQKKARQPFVVVLRSQLGQFTGCTVAFPPGKVDFPDSPPLPPPPAPRVTNPVTRVNPPPATTLPPALPPSMGMPLVIIGTNVGTNWPPPAPPSPPRPEPVVQTNAAPAPPGTPLTNPVMPAISVPATNPAAPVTPANLPVAVEPARETNLIVPPAPVPVPATNAAARMNGIEPTNVVARTNGVVAPTENSGSGHAGALILGAGLLIAAGALGAFAVVRARRADRGSLITRTMNQK
jgi:hypothetical protein